MTEQAAATGGTTRTPVRSYITRFAADEDPISEGGMWLNGKRDGIEWANVIVRKGLAHGAPTMMSVAERRLEQGNLTGADADVGAPEGDYDDPTAVLTGPWGRNQHAKGRVFSRNQTEEYFQEVELRLRSTIALHVCTGYEVFFRCLKTENAYAEIVRWNGPRGDFTSLRKLSGPNYGVQDGDLVEATIDGNVFAASSMGWRSSPPPTTSTTQAAPGSGSTSSSATLTSIMGSRFSRSTPTTTECSR